MVAIDLKLDLWPRQLEALNTDATELLFGGATEGGKSHFVRVALITWCLGIPGLQCILIRKKYDDIIKNHLDGPTGFRNMLAPLIKHKAVDITLKGITFYNGSQISFMHCQDERQFDSAQGVEKGVMVIDEATQISERLIRFFRAWCRMPTEAKEALPDWAKGKFPRIIYTANPIGASVGFFRRNFVKARLPTEIEYIDGFHRQYIPSRYTDNKSVDVMAHIGRLQGIGDPALARALDEGDWDAPLGDYFPQYDDSKHAVPAFDPPEHWFKFRTFDWGSAEPFAVLWWTVSDGVNFQDNDGRVRWFPRGALIAYREWYGCYEVQLPNGEWDVKPNKGCEMRNQEMAEGIISRSRLDGKTSGLTITDSLPFQDRGMSQNGKKYRIADVFKEQGVPLVMGNCARITGWAQVRDRLIGIDGFPLLYFTSNCKYAREYLPAIGRSQTRPEDAEESGEATHICFTADTLVKTFRGNIPIVDVVDGDLVKNKLGQWCKTTGAFKTKNNTKIIKMSFSDGSQVKCTPDHLFFTPHGLTRAIDMVGLACIVDPCKELLSYQIPSKNSWVEYIHYTSNDTTGYQGLGFIEKFGNTITEAYQKAFTSIISITIDTITRLKTYLFSPPQSIYGFTDSSMLIEQKSLSKLLKFQPQYGTAARKDLIGTKSITRKSPNMSFIKELKELVRNVARSLAEVKIQGINSALQSVNKFPILKTLQNKKKEYAEFACPPFNLTNIQEVSSAQNFARKNTSTLYCTSIDTEKNADVFCITVPNFGHFALANGAIVRNCDCIRLACTTRPMVTDKKDPDEGSKSNNLMTPKKILNELKRRYARRH